jgi:hypothetical protein
MRLIGRNRSFTFVDTTTTEAKPHTPGPWTVHPLSVGVCDGQHGSDQGCRCLAEAEILEVPRAEAIANARLIASAPDLHAAAHGAWRLCQSLLAARERATDDVIREVAEALQAAIRKAEQG